VAEENQDHQEEVVAEDQEVVLIQQEHLEQLTLEAVVELAELTLQAEML
jgi:hypothetical protein